MRECAVTSAYEELFDTLPSTVVNLIEQDTINNYISCLLGALPALPIIDMWH